jgi:hypothetical protein
MAQTPERALRALQGLVRQSPLRGDGAVTRKHTNFRVLPDNDPGEQAFVFSGEEATALALAEAALQHDQRFEYLSEREIRDRVWRFFCVAFYERSKDYVAEFLSTIERTPLDTVCFLPVEYLEVVEEIEVLGVRLLPVSHPDVPTETMLRLEPPVGSVMVLPIQGTSYQQMHLRARTKGQRVLSVLRLSLREVIRDAPDFQLRFRLGSSYAIPRAGTGGQWPEDFAAPLRLTPPDALRAAEVPISRVDREGKTDVEKRAVRAAEWLSQALLVDDEVKQMLFAFFALETVLGDPAEGEKGLNLAFRRTLLGHLVSGQFTEPDLVYASYDQQRSAGVHGEDVPEIRRRELNSIIWGIRRSINEFVEFAEQQGLNRRSQVVRALDNHPEAPRILEWLKARSRIWQDYSLPEET